jgi:hypothetical protein
MGKAIRAFVLVLLLSYSAQAGWMQNGSPEPPPPSPPASAVQEPTAGGEIPNDVTDSLTRMALDLLAVLPPLL